MSAKKVIVVFKNWTSSLNYNRRYNAKTRLKLYNAWSSEDRWPIYTNRFSFK